MGLWQTLVVSRSVHIIPILVLACYMTDRVVGKGWMTEQKCIQIK